MLSLGFSFVSVIDDLVDFQNLVRRKFGGDILDFDNLIDVSFQGLSI